MVHGDFGSSQLCLFVEVLSAPGCFLSFCYNACLWDLPPWLWRACSSFLSYSTGPASVVTSAASCWLLASLQDWRLKPLLTDSSFLSCWKIRAADAMCYWKEAPCVPLCKWRCLCACLWCLFFAHRDAGGPGWDTGHVGILVPQQDLILLEPIFFSSLNWVHWSGFLFSSLLFLCLFAGKQMKLDRAENRSPEFQRVPITSSGSQVCWPERLVLAEPRPVSPSCFCLSHILLHFSWYDCHSLSTWADSLLTPLIYLVADGCQQLPHFRKLPPMTPKHKQLKSRIDKLHHINIYTSAPQTRPSRKWKDNPRNKR